MDLNSLKLFATVIEAGSMSRAAARLGISQSAVSQAVKALEANLAAELLDRSRKPVRPTAAGETLYGESRTLLADAERLRALVGRTSGQGLARLQLGLVDSICAAVGPGIVPTLDGLAQVWSLQAGLSHEIVDSFLNRALDLAVISEPVLPRGLPLLQEEICRETYLLAVPKSYAGPLDRLERLCSEVDLIRYSARSAIGQQIDRHLTRLRLTPPRRMEFDDAEPTLAMVASARGFAITTPLCVLQGQTWLPRIRLAPLPGPRLTKAFLLIARAGRCDLEAEALTAACRRSLRDEALPRAAKLDPLLAQCLTVPPES
ncbi:LysR family transcriptional regulator [Algihabitans sp.]|uniref:LysR family transcriptional regulator n=1 Tax=Algihabitans sp. TaxID=2821514 RepID=UPI003BAD5785